MILERVFQLQDEVINRNIAQFKDRYDFISACIDLAGRPEIPALTWESLPVSKRIVFNYFHGDALSTMINATRLGFQGCGTDAYALMRVVIEQFTVFEYIMRSDKYDIAMAELSTKVSKNSAKALSYEAAIKELGIADRRKRLWGDFSKLGSHSSSQRLRMSRFTVGDQDFPKMGCSINDPRTKMTVGELASSALWCVRITDEFLQRCLGGQVSPFHQRRLDLENSYERLRKDKRSNPSVAFVESETV